MGPDRDPAWLDRWWLPLALCAAVTLAYAPSLSGGFLNYDDPWLIADNPNFEPGAWDTPLRAFTSLDRASRLGFGAEYLPLRDLSVWLDTRLFGKAPQPMRAVNLLLYLGAVLLLRGTLRRVLGRGLRAELAAWLFALHPVHAESVAWLSGRKDVLALVFVSAALFTHAGQRPGRPAWVALWVACASLAKSMSVAVILLLVAQDLFMGRRLRLRDYAPSASAVALTMALHLYVGSVVGMVTVPPGGSRATALITMGPVWLRYLGLCLFPSQLSVVHDVPDRTHWDLPALSGYAFVAAWGALAAWGVRRRRPLAPFSFLWFFGPLGPVSQVIAPLQNRMADRYAWLSVLAPCLLLAWWLGDPGSWRAAKLTLAAGLCLALVGATGSRASLFADSVALFADATAKTTRSTVAPYQLGKALEARGEDGLAIAAFRLVLLRSPRGPDRNAAAATNNLARLLARRGALAEAEAVLVAGLRRFPENAKIRGNLVKVLAKQGREEDARAVADGLTP